MIYVDMDGVLANLYDYICLRTFQTSYSSIRESQREVLKTIFRNKIYFNHAFPEGAERVFEDLEPYPFNQTLIETVMKFGGEYTILSRPGSLDPEGISRAKHKWVEKHLAFCPPKEVLLVQDKTANGRAPGNVLIDDYDPFLQRWREKGGHAIEYKAWTFNTNDDIKRHLNVQLQDKYI